MDKIDVSFIIIMVTIGIMTLLLSKQNIEIIKSQQIILDKLSTIKG